MINGTIIGEINIAIRTALNGMCGLLKPKAATVPSAVARSVAIIPIKKLFLVPSIHLLDTTVVSPMLLIPTICLYHLRDQASGSKFINSLVNSKNGDALNESGRIIKIGEIKKKKTKAQ